jgi:hypothetical protein
MQPTGRQLAYVRDLALKSSQTFHRTQPHGPHRRPRGAGARDRPRLRVERDAKTQGVRSRAPHSHAGAKPPMSRPALTSAEAFSSVFESAAPRAKPSITLAIALASETALSSRSEWQHCGLGLARVPLFLFSEAEPVDCRWDRPGTTVVTCGMR